MDVDLKWVIITTRRGHFHRANQDSWKVMIREYWVTQRITKVMVCDEYRKMQNTTDVVGMA